jgi:hypothetical protein
MIFFETTPTKGGVTGTYMGELKKPSEAAHMRKSLIISAIEAKVATSPWDIWRIGITQDLEEQKVYWENSERQTLAYWSEWDANTLAEAQDVEAEMTRRGMKGSPAVRIVQGKQVYVYVF